ncbi:MAG: peptidoglycan-binding protein [Ilumatobacter sp.]|uniref:peptidoglycan-binding protein n=1 Tax=Ilumatobacter sp. TaxID=1967498 RepID=UPI0032984579
MTIFPRTVPRTPRLRPSIRRRLIQGVCVTALTAVVVGASGATTSAAPGAAIEAPVAVSAAFTGLRVGSQGSDVQALQRALIAAGITVPGGADGVFGPATRQAVVAFQNARGLSATGDVDQATAAALTSPGTAGTSSGAVLSVGARGPQVTAVQKRLVALGVYLAGGADGVFGPSTKRAVTQFQGWNGLEQTGTVNAATATKLGVGAPGAGSATPPATAPTTPPAAGINAYVGLAQGARGALVKDLQTALQRKGLVVRGGADGVFGSATATALKALQRVNALSETGVVGQREAAILGLGTATAPPAATPSTSQYLGLEVGARGPAVKDAQQALIAAGVPVRGGADGVFGNVTKSALTTYQTALGITADGTVNQATIDKLGLGSSSAPTPMPAAGSTPATPPAAGANPYVGLSVGSSGPLVRELQTALQRTGLVVRGGADGSFGPATRTALIAFQSVNGIPQTGVVTAQGAAILGLGSGSVGIVNPGSGGNVTLARFPVQGRCFFGDTWHDARSGGRRHEGVDIIANEGKLLYAVVDGEISKQYWDSPGALAGNGLRIAQPNGTYFTYLHMSGFAPGITVGTQVKAGDVIGFVGNTGSSATAHLHFEIHPGGGAAVNPYPYVKAIDDCSNTTPRYQSSFA